MKILILSATQFEIAPFLQTNPHTDILVGGVGILSTAYHLTKQLAHHHYDLVLQAGLAGMFLYNDHRDFLELGQVVMVHQDAVGDLGVYEKQKWQSVQDMQLSYAPEWLHNPHWVLHKLSYKKVTAITVNSVTDDATIIKALQEKWQPDIETMEGAALHFVCMQRQIPFLQIRAISNVVGERDKTNWKIKEALENLNSSLSAIIQQTQQN